MSYSIKIDDAAINRYVNDSQGDVARDLRRRGRAVERRAKALVGVDTRALQRSIRSRVTPGVAGPVLHVGSDLPYALAHHEGTRPHVISPESRRVLRFKVGGKVVYAQRTQHPGTRRNPFLTNALREAAK